MKKHLFSLLLTIVASSMTFVHVAAASFDGFEATTNNKMGNQIYSQGLIQNTYNVTLIETDATKHKYNINLTKGGEGTFQMGGVTFSFTNDEAGKTAYKTYDTYIQPNGVDREIRIPTTNGEKVKVVLVEACDDILVNGTSTNFVGGENILTAKSSSIILRNPSTKPKISAILSAGNSGGTSGGNITWTLNNGTLVISGTGDMTNYYDLDSIPWYSKRGTINSLVIKDGVTSIGRCAFSGCSSLTSVTIGNSVTSIGEQAFSDCSGLISVTIPNSVTSIGGSAFSDCSGLTSVNIPNSVTSIINTAFCRCSGLTSMIVESGNTKYDSRNNCNAIIETSTNTLVTGCKTTIIPNSVTSIGDYAFMGRTGLTSVIIPNSVTSIGNYAFYRCSSLTSITIPSSVTNIGNSAFSGCNGLTSMIVESGNIKYDSRNNCNAIIETSTNTLVRGCKTTIIPNSVTSIGGYAFSLCSGLTSVAIPNSVTSIGEGAFYDCSNLTSVTIPNSVTNIERWPFSGCISLSSVIFGSSVKVIESNAFDGCNAIKTITCYSMRPPTVEYFAFPDLPYSIIVYVPSDYLIYYLVHDFWGSFDVQPIGAKSTETNGVQVTPTGNTANVVWPTVSGAATYELVIKDKQGNIICTLFFNAQGQLTSIAFHARGNGKAPQQTQAAGFSFTVTGLDSGTTYDYSLTAKDAQGTVLETKTGTFTTDGATALEDIFAEQTLEEVLANPETKIYTLQGVEVSRDAVMRHAASGSLQTYIFVFGNKTGKAVVGL